ncbi:MAG: ferritin-like domain-containing protein [Candidatus Sulfotelmatobacter sp.]
MEKLNEPIKRGFSRRKFLAGVGAGAGAVAAINLAGCSNNPVPSPVITPSPSSSYTDDDILNFALNLEYLEAQFYLYAATGAGLQASDTTAGSASPYQTAGTVTVGSAAAVPGLTPAQQQIINEIAYEEQEHVRFLRSALGSAAVPMPDIDLSFFGPLAETAKITTSATGSGAFNPFSTFDYFLVGGFIFEDVGVTAYSGAAPLISPAGVAAGYLTAAAGILAVEAYHAGYIRTSLTAGAMAAGSETAYPYLSSANLVEDLRAALTVGDSAAPSTTGSVETLLTLPTNLTTPSSIVPASPTTAVGFARTVNQVLHIVYGSATVGVNSGGFFPSGINSIFATTTA